MKILYVSTISITMNFFKEHFKMLTAEGHSIEVACNFNGSIPDFLNELNIKSHHIPFSRSPLSKGNFLALKQLKNLIKKENYDIVHTHTPNASICTRISCRSLRKKGLRVFYTAHGFHFFKGAPLKNWLIYFPFEWICSFFTDKLITLNKEDFEFAKKHMHAKKILYVPGVGVNTQKFNNLSFDKLQMRKELGIPNDATVLLSVGELNNNKNHQAVIKAINGMDLYYLIVGSGSNHDDLQQLINSQNMSDKIKLLGYRNDINKMCAISDIFVFPSYREGLSVSVMEAMASGLACSVSKIRGNTDLIDQNGGTLFDPHNIEDCKNAIVKLINSDTKKMSEYNMKKIQHFSFENVLKEMREIYK